MKRFQSLAEEGAGATQAAEETDALKTGDLMTTIQQAGAESWSPALTSLSSAPSDLVLL